MSKQYYAVRLNPSRPDFAMTMTDEERAVMNAHIAYWQPHLASGVMVVYGPVMDPGGPYGLGVVCVDSEAQLKELLAADPASTINRYEYHAMMAVVGNVQAAGV